MSMTQAIIAVVAVLCIPASTEASPAGTLQLAATSHQTAYETGNVLTKAIYRKGRDRRRIGYYSRREQRRLGLWSGRRTSGPPYGRCFMNCINSSHPADFCQNQAYHFCDF
jgi:hypothetical protein